ncbi:MAG: sigma-70 family RNA polymerase sigma factor [Lentisphaeria bacterium]|nr:sigma-70 family RNA polymerase sigma factor [Lentisphaeria bacterium]
MDNTNLVKFTKQWSASERVIRLYLNSAIYNRADAQDVLQRVALCAYQKYDEYDASQSFQGWLFGIAKFEVLGYFRNLGRNPEVIDSEITERLADNMEDQSEAIYREDDERREKLEKLLTQLPEKAQELVRLRFFENREYDEIAQLLNTNEGAVRTALSRIIAKLRSMAKESMQEAM